MRGWRTYAPFADNHGIDFLARHSDGREMLVQVKSVRERTYAYVSKDTIKDQPNVAVALVLCDEGVPPQLFVVPIEAWRAPNALLADRDYVGLKSKPEFGLQAARANEELLLPFLPDRVLK